MPEFADRVKWEKVVIKTRAGAARFRDLREVLGRFPPIPSIVVEGELAFPSTPSPEALRGYLAERLGGST